MKRALALPLLIPLVLAVSGCTIPGTDIELPFPDIFGDTTVNYANDIIIIKSMQVTPSTTVKSGQTMTLYADIQNVQDPEKAAGERIESVSVELYDYCTTLFKNDIKSSLNKECQGTFGMSPQEIKTCHWTLIPRDVNLITPCQLKLRVNYKYTTRTVTSITFIDSEELEARIRRGDAWKVSGSTSRGYGPVKAYVEVETQQPVPYGDTSKTPASVSIVIKNVGQGYIKDAELSGNLIHTQWLDADGQLIVESQTGSGPCKFQPNTEGSIDIIRKQTTPLFCKVRPVGDINVEQTYDMMVIVGEENAGISHNKGYDYEFRKSIDVQIEPR